MEELPQSTNEVLATVDLGSNSFRLLIAKIRPDGTLFPVDEIKETVRLAGGLDENNYLTKESQSRALEVLSRFGERLLGFDKSRVRVVATSTLRVAKNALEFIALGNKILGFRIEVIAGSEEARLIYIGAAHSLPYTQNSRLVIDIGGGSTEFIIGSGYDPKVMESVTMGCVSFSNRYFKLGELSSNNFDNAIYAARGKIQAMEHLFAPGNWSEAIGCSGTARALYELCLSHGTNDQITLNALYKIRKILQKCKTLDNLTTIAVKAERRPVIAGGLAIMIAVMEELSIESMTISDGSLREGVMYDLLGRTGNHDLRDKTVTQLKKRYEIDEIQAAKVAMVSLEIFKRLESIVKVDMAAIKLLQWASELYEIGLSISHNDYHKHGAYILANLDMAGFSRPEQTLLADLVRMHRGNLLKSLEILRENRKVKPWLLFMVLALRFSVIFNRNRTTMHDHVILAVRNLTKDGFELITNELWLTQNPLTLYSLNEELTQWQRLGIDIKLVCENH